MITTPYKRTKKFSSSLVIVDMQKIFTASNNRRVIKSVISSIERARENKEFIFLVEIIASGHGKTHECIYNALDGYRYWVKCGKMSNDGSRSIFGKIKRYNIDVSNFKVCGVNTCACVYDTVEGLESSVRTESVKVIRAACNDGNDYYKSRDCWPFPRRQTLVLKRTKK